MEERHDSKHFALTVSFQAVTLQKGTIQRGGFSRLPTFPDSLF
jgi:hypothetical protein